MRDKPNSAKWAVTLYHYRDHPLGIAHECHVSCGRSSLPL